MFSCSHREKSQMSWRHLSIRDIFPELDNILLNLDLIRSANCSSPLITESKPFRLERKTWQRLLYAEKHALPRVEVRHERSAPQTAFEVIHARPIHK
jgi:hypothetical protein